MVHQKDYLKVSDKTHFFFDHLTKLYFKNNLLFFCLSILTLNILLTKNNFILILEAQQRLLLVTVFALSVHYQPVDVSLAISTGLLNVLSQLCGTDTMLGQPLQLLPKTGISQLSTALKVASTRLLQILAITTG